MGPEAGCPLSQETTVLILRDQGTVPRKSEEQQASQVEGACSAYALRFQHADDSLMLLPWYFSLTQIPFSPSPGPILLLPTALAPVQGSPRGLQPTLSM